MRDDPNEFRELRAAWYAICKGEQRVIKKPKRDDSLILTFQDIVRSRQIITPERAQELEEWYRL